MLSNNADANSMTFPSSSLGTAVVHYLLHSVFMESQWIPWGSRCLTCPQHSAPSVHRTSWHRMQHWHWQAMAFPAGATANSVTVCPAQRTHNKAAQQETAELLRTLRQWCSIFVLPPKHQVFRIQSDTQKHSLTETVGMEKHCQIY